MEMNETPNSEQLDLFDLTSDIDATDIQEVVDAFLEGYYSAWLKEPSILTISSTDEAGHIIPMVRVREDMVMEYGPTYTPDAAAKAFWQALEIEGKSLAVRLVESVSMIEMYMERAERSSSCYIIADAEREALRRENQELKFRLKALSK